jgi:predicted nucleotidyltransferase
MPTRQPVSTTGPARERQGSLREIVRRIVAVAAPESIVLFGSAARGKARPDSDLDLLVIKSGDFHHGRLTEDIYMSLLGVDRAVDIVVATPKRWSATRVPLGW